MTSEEGKIIHVTSKKVDYIRGITVKAKLRIKCRNCGSWNKIEVEKIFVNSGNSESKLKIFLPAYLPLNSEKCYKCNRVIAEKNRIIGKRN